MRVIEQMTNSEKVLAKAVLTAAQKIGLTHDQLAMILDINLSITNIDYYRFSLPQKEVALKLIRITVAVDTLSGSNISTIQHFMKYPNKITKVFRWLKSKIFLSLKPFYNLWKAFKE